MAKVIQQEVLVTPHKMWIWMLCSLRYAMGRRSTVVSDIAEDLIQYFHVFDDYQRKQFIREIREELQRAENMGVTLGDPMDHNLWQATADKLESRL